MADTRTAVTSKPIWVDLSSTDAAGSRAFYAKLFGWTVEASPDPQYGGYAIAKIGDKNVAGIGPAQAPDQPSAWSVYIGSQDAEATARKVEAAGGTVVVAPFDVADQGRMAVFQDPSGAFISAWQPRSMAGSELMGVANTYGWAELNSRGIDTAIPFYQEVFGWTTKQSPMSEDGAMVYTEFQLGGQSIAGGMDMNPMVPAEVPSYWLAYFTVPDVDASYRKAIDGGAKEMLAPQDFSGGRFAILSDPQGAAFGLLKMQGA
jgi:predicted enzyme related to lactoylglutathione lyase